MMNLQLHLIWGQPSQVKEACRTCCSKYRTCIGSVILGILFYKGAVLFGGGGDLEKTLM